MDRFKHNEIVGIKEFRDSEYNCHGRVNDSFFAETINERLYHVTNMNMPFQGTVSEWFKSKDLFKL